MNTRLIQYRRYLNAVGLMLAVWLLSAWSVQARAELAANVHFVSGYVAATAPGAAARELAKGDDLFSGDRVDTAENGRVQMRFTDGGLVSLMPNSTFSIDEYLHEGQADEDASLVFGLLRGGLRTVTGSIGSVQHDQYELKTPVATLGIRGTEYVAVLRPANTLRVHVGRGKVVITNEQGSLEVPEGRNAVVTLGSAPEFSDQGPQYQATGPLGDRLFAGYQHRQDPDLLDPRVNMPLPEATFTGLTVVPGAPGGGGSTPPITLPSTPLPPGTHQLAALFPPTSSASGFGPQNIALDFDNDGVLTSLDLGTFDTGTWQSFEIVTSGAVSWGEFTGGTGYINGDDVVVGSGQYAPYVVGTIPTTVPTSGTLNFTLDGATPARAHDTGTGNLFDSGTLAAFNLGIDLGSNPGMYTLDMQLNMNTLGSYTVTGGAGSLSTAHNWPHFGITQSITGGTCSSGCSMDIQGFVAGSTGGQAGIVYDFTDGSNRISGAAGLKDDANLGI